MLIVSMATVAPSHAQEGGLAVLRIGLNAAAAGMADSYVAHSRDAYAVYWNPAGLAAAGSNSVGLSFHAWLANLQTYAIASRFQAGKHAGLGLFVVTQGESDLQSRSRPGPPDGFFSVQYVSAGVAYGRAFGPLRAGVTAKYLGERIFDVKANGYAFDFGLQGDFIANSLQLGAALQHLGRMSELASERTHLPTTLRAGVAFFPFRVVSSDAADIMRTMVTAEVVHLLNTDSGQAPSTELHLGVSARVVDLVEVRGGIMTNNTLRRFTLGTGIVFNGFLFDYAYMPFHSGFQGGGHILTLTYDW